MAGELMGEIWGHPPEWNDKIQDEHHKDLTEEAREAHIADEVSPPWWRRMWRAIKNSGDGYEGTMRP
jgi:hypothetical protein